MSYFIIQKGLTIMLDFYGNILINDDHNFYLGKDTETSDKSLALLTNTAAHARANAPHTVIKHEPRPASF